MDSRDERLVGVDGNAALKEQKMDEKLQRLGLKSSGNPEDASEDSFFPDTEQIPQFSSYLPSDEASACTAAHITSHDIAFQDAKMVTIRAKYNPITSLMFRLPMWSGIAQLQLEVAKRLKVEAETYNIRYKGEDGKVILLACDKDVQECMQSSISLGKTKIDVFLEFK
ncbi:hypothetical protein Vadar_003185 [Vaccinium darrowii]|uniref:Uncharacterized protein n=1 Tax=Vaccinium darrowii TaxID=229202 RepID=A0ACB7XF05_9ERIC|nr:hypothetical protein Vadar_003185 [Vaccinium darrowii]